MKTETLTHSTTNAEALATMEETGLDALVVVDRKGRFEGSSNGTDFSAG